MEKFDELQHNPEVENKLKNKRQSLFTSYWFNLDDNEKLDFNQDLASIILDIVKASLDEVFKTWKKFNDQMKEENRPDLKIDLKETIRNQTKLEVQKIDIERNVQGLVKKEVLRLNEKEKLLRKTLQGEELDKLIN